MARYDPARFPLSLLRLLPQPGRLAGPLHDYATYGYGCFACVWKATGQVIEFARSTLGLARLVAMVHPDNVASAHVVAKLGFTVAKKAALLGAARRGH